MTPTTRDAGPSCRQGRFVGFTRALGLVVLGWPLAAFGAEAGRDKSDLPTWQLTAVEGLDQAGWTQSARHGGRAFRAARGRRKAILSAKPWWGDSFRPPEGTVYILRVSYRDKAESPVRFLSHAGVAPHWGLTEVHRFGGSGDGNWKTADLPLSWDLICRKNVPGGPAEIAFAAPTDLPIESIRVLPAEAGSAERYFDETRRWVARAQAAKRKIASRGPQQDAVIPEGMKDRGIVPYPCSWVTPLWQNAAPQSGQAGAAVKVRMARNEYEPGAFAVYANGKPLAGVTYSVTPLEGAAGRLTCELDLRTAEYSAVQETVDYGTSADSGKYRMYPQRLWPAHPVDIEKAQSHLFWITVRTLGAASRPGRYTGRITIKDASGRAAGELPMEVEVLPVTLPTVNEAGLRLGNCTLGLPTLQEVRTLAEHNHNGMDLWFGCTYPKISFPDGKLAIDWTYLDDWMAYARKCGMTEMVWFFGGDPKRFPNSLELERDLYRLRGRTGPERSELYREFRRKTSENPDRVIPELRPLYVEFIRRTAEHAKANNWPRLVLHPFDEPGKWVARRPKGNDSRGGTGAGPWIEGHFRDCCRLIRQAWPDATVGLEAHVVKPCLVFLKDVNVFCTNRAYQDAALARKLAENNVEFWQYANCDDQAPAHRTRYSFGFYFASFGSRGSLVWAYNWLRRFDTSGRGNWGSAWSTPFGTVFCPSLVGLREGLDDRRWIEALKALAGEDPSVRALLAEILKQARAERAETPYTSYNETRDPRKLDHWRGRIMDAVVAASRR